MALPPREGMRFELMGSIQGAVGSIQGAVGIWQGPCLQAGIWLQAGSWGPALKQL